MVRCIHTNSTGGVLLTTFDPARKGTSVTLSNGNLTASISGAIGIGAATVGKSTGKWYWEMVPQLSNNQAIGIVDGSVNLNDYMGSSTHSVGYFATGTINYNSSVIVSGMPTYASGNIIGCALDMINGALYFAISNTWINSGVPTSGASKTGAVKTGLTGTWYPAASNVGSAIVNGKFTTGHTYSPPSGYLAI